MEQTLKLTGNKTDYSVQEVAVPSGGVELAIIGTSQKTQNEIYSLTGYLQIHFKDGVVDLLTTSLAINSIIAKSTNTLKKESWQKYEESSTIEEDSQNNKAKIWDISSSNINRPQQATETVDFDYLNIKHNNVGINIANKIQNTESEATQNNTILLTEEKIKQTTTTNTQNDISAELLKDLKKTNQEQINNIENIFNQVQGTSGPDKLIGLNGRNIIDGLRNTELENFTFIEELIGGPDSDIIYYRGFWGDNEAATTLEALINGNGGQNTIHVALDQSTNVSINGGISNQNQLILEAPPGIDTPWNPIFILWDWSINDNNEYLLNGNYINPSHSNAYIKEITPSFNSISSASGATLNLYRPIDENIKVINGTMKDDWILGLEDTKIIKAGDGNDIVIAKQGTIVDLGSGIDTVFSLNNDYTLSFESSIFGARVNLQNNTAIVFDDELNLWSLDRIMTTPKSVIDSKNNDIIFGNQQNNSFVLTGGQDKLYNGGGENAIFIANNPAIDFIDINDFKWINNDRIYFDIPSILKNTGYEYGAISFIFNEEKIFYNELIENESAILKLHLSDDLNFIMRENNQAFINLNNYLDGINPLEYSINDFFNFYEVIS